MAERLSGGFFYVFDGETPSYELLAKEALACARRRDQSENLWHRLKLLRIWRRLRRVARWQDPSYQGRFRFLWAQGVRRYGLTMFWFVLAFAAVQAIRNPIAEPSSWLTAMAFMGLLCFVLGTVWAAFDRAYVLDEQDWAKTYRTSRLKLEERYKSPEGIDGWRLELDAAGHWTFREIVRRDGAT
jgi:hypothetical protein